jgi:gliding motility-associated-like protein
MKLLTSMKGKFTIYFLFVLLSFCSMSGAKAQVGLCPTNMDFEQGDFSNWVCKQGTVAISGGVNTITWTSMGPPLPTFQTMITPLTAGLDPWGNFPTLCPNGSNNSIMLGNGTASLSGGIGREASGVTYTYSIPATATVFSILFYYAIVLEDPSHTPEAQPRFRARIRDVGTGMNIPCVDFDFIASSSLPGFLPSPFNFNVKYKDWTPISIDLTGMAGKTIELEFITTECTQNGHFAYAYVDVNSTCNGAITGTTICPGDPSITLSAPFGFQAYEWWDNTFSNILSTSQTLFLSPPPAAGTVFPVIVFPYPGFGCKDTLYATLTVGTAPAANAGPDQLVCNGQQVQIGAPNNPIYDYLWTPAAQVSNPSVSNPFAWTFLPTPDEFIVRTTDILTGCISYDTTYLTARTVDTALVLNGKNIYCAGDPTAGTLSVPNVLSSVQWYDGGVPIPGATGYSYQPSVSGNYWAQVQQNGCTDSTRTESFTVNPRPASIAGPDASICTYNQTIQLGAPSNPSYTYSWTPATQVSNATIGDPIAWAIGNSTTEFIVHTTDPLTGCNTYDTVYITGRVVDTSIVLNGKNDFCASDPAWGSLSVSNTLASVQWYDGTTAIPGATGFIYRPLVTGNYWAQIQQNGCTDSTATIPFGIHPLPLVSFTPSSDTGCVTNHSFLFINGSTASDGSSMSYLWKLGDGSTQTITDAVKTYLAPGNYPVKLITTTSFGCSDSTNNFIVHVVPNGKANFRWDSICTNRPSYFYNLSNENGSAQVSYNWTFNNGGPGSNLKNPQPIVYTTAGQTDVTLILTALGCENDPDSIVKRVQVNVQKPGITYRSITVPQGIKEFIHARDSVGNFFNWRPKVQLSDYNARYTQFNAVDDVLYLIDISDLHTCITTDTLQMLVLKKPGYYLPTAFTPNGDGLNDDVQPYLVGMKGLKSFSVFNRWGNLIFYTNTYGKKWNGKMNGVDQNPGVYVWILEFYDSNNKLVTEKGTITLIR